MAYEERGRTAPPPAPKKAHNLTLEERKRLAVSGVEDVESFDEHEIVMLTGEGRLNIRGEGLSISRLSVDNGDVNVQGVITELRYEEAVPEHGLWARLFR